MRRQIRISDEAVSRLVRQQTDTHYRTMLDKLHRLFVAGQRRREDAPRLGRTPIPYGHRHGAIPGIAVQAREIDGARGHGRIGRRAFDERRRAGPEGHGRDVRPRLTHMIGLIRRDPVKTADGRFVDFAASFNRLPREERRESELIGFLSALRTQDGPATVAWHCVSIDGGERVWRTRPILTTEAALDEIIEEG